jgi:membrane-bound serine protease (ClpP class)
MEIILNPNVAYLILVFAFLAAILSLFSPGTGVIEITALVLMVFSGWLIFKLKINIVALVILIFGVFPFLLALRKTRKWYHFVISLAALSLGSTFIFVTEGWKPAVNPVLAIFVNILMIGFLWVIIRKSLDAVMVPIRNRLVEIVGETGETRSKVHLEGTIYLNGELWSAVSRQPINEYKKVRVISKQGYILEVEEIKEPENQN